MPLHYKAVMITLDEVKTILQITDNANDALLFMLIQQAKEDIIKYCNNPFLSPYVYFYGTATIAGDTITTQGVFEDLIPGDYLLRGSYYNDGYITVTNVAEKILTISEPMTDDEEGSIITLQLLVYPKSIKTHAALYIKWLMAKNGKLESNESISGYSATFKSYSEIMSPFRQYRIL